MYGQSQKQESTQMASIKVKKCCHTQLAVCLWITSHFAISYRLTCLMVLNNNLSIT